MNIPPGIPLPPGNDSLNQTDEMPFTFSVAHYLQGYNVEVQPTKGSVNSIDITIERNWIEIALVLIITVILFLASIMAFIYSLLLWRSGETIDIWSLIAMVGLLVVIPSTRSVIVPAQIGGRTLVELILLACLCFLIFSLFVLVFRYRQQKKQN
jgi:heme/copper-type cytochrome/quinol oxidase subunit 2